MQKSSGVASRTRSAPDAAAEAEHDVGLAIDAMRRIMRELRIIARKTELSAGLTAAQSFVLSVLSSGPAMSVSEIAAATMTDRSSAAAVVDRLVDSGYATRSASAVDRRRAVIGCTTRGRRALRRATPPPTVVLLAAVRELQADDRRSLARGLTALTRSLGIHDRPAGMLFEEVPRPRASRARRARG